MKIELKRVNDAFHFQAKNEMGNRVDIDGPAKIGGSNIGPNPMELLIMGLGGCSGIDVVMILKKQKQEIEHFEISIDAEREVVDAPPSLFTWINVHFKLTGQIDKEKAERAVALAMEKYCSVARTLEKTAKISFTLSLNTQNIPLATV